jgi:predicted dehydrogenase
MKLNEVGKKEINMNIAIIGLGTMGSSHVKDVMSLNNATLYAVCDIDRDRADTFASQTKAKAFYSHQDLLQDSEINAVIIATPHYDHTPIAIAALKRGIHVLVEKPVAVHANDAQKMIDAYENAKIKFTNLVFSAMFQQRTMGYSQKIKDLIDSQELGRLVRTSWIVTDWFRTQTYYNNGGWRATWRGEGGGVLLNQCPHNLDLYQWFVGLPKTVHGHVNIGKYHNIEVEDEVTAYFEFENGMVGHFITTTAESPGTNRLEIVGELGKLVFEDDELTFFRNRNSMLETIETSPFSFKKVENWKINIPYDLNNETPHKKIIINFIDAIENGAPLIAPAPEGIRSVSLGNAILLSSLLKKPVTLPLDGDLYEDELNKLIANSQFVKKTASDKLPSDFSQSF